VWPHSQGHSGSMWRNNLSTRVRCAVDCLQDLEDGIQNNSYNAEEVGGNTPVLQNAAANLGFRSKSVSYRRETFNSSFPSVLGLGGDGRLGRAAQRAFLKLLHWFRGAFVVPRHCSLRLARCQLKHVMLDSAVQQTICALILLDSASVFGECIVDALIDDRKDVPGTWVHIAYIVEHGLSLLGTGLLPFFICEIAALLLCLGFHFFENPIYILDLVMLSLTFLQELVQPLVGRRLEHSFALLLRVWRVLRVAHGVYMIMFLRQESMEKELQNLRKQLVKLQHLHGAEARKCVGIINHESSTLAVTQDLSTAVPTQDYYSVTKGT